jgi:hypothetical protein
MSTHTTVALAYAQYHELRGKREQLEAALRNVLCAEERARLDLVVSSPRGSPGKGDSQQSPQWASDPYKRSTKQYAETEHDPKWGW